MAVSVRVTPAARRLEWLLDGLDAPAGWGADVDQVLAPEFTALVSPAVFVATYRRRAQRFAPVTVSLVQAEPLRARADLHDAAGNVAVLHCHVEPTWPHRIVRTWMEDLVPDHLSPRLPVDFAGHELPSRDSQTRLVVLSGVPGSGKSTIADAIGRALGVPVFAEDWVLGALTPFGGRHLDQLREIGAELLTTLAYRQLVAAQSVVLDSTAEDTAVRKRWLSLAHAAHAQLRVVVCVCRDRRVHRARVQSRLRGIPGWHDAGDWADAASRLATFVPWPADVLTVDTSRPLDVCVAEALAYIRAGAGSAPAGPEWTPNKERARGLEPRPARSADAGARLNAGMAERVSAHLASFNAAVTTGSWDAFVATFAESARVELSGVVAGPYVGRDAIAAAYRDTPPDDTMTALDVRSTPWTDTVRFEWSRGGTGTLWLAWTGAGTLNRMVVDLD